MSQDMKKPIILKELVEKLPLAIIVNPEHLRENWIATLKEQGILDE